MISFNPRSESISGPSRYRNAAHPGDLFSADAISFRGCYGRRGPLDALTLRPPSVISRAILTQRSETGADCFCGTIGERTGVGAGRSRP